MLCSRGEAIRAHEFHYWDSDDCGQSCMAQKPGVRPAVALRRTAAPGCLPAIPTCIFTATRSLARRFCPRRQPLYQKEWKL